MYGAELFVKTLADEGVEYVFSLPGTCLMDMYDAFAKQDKVKLIVTRHEQVATLMADGYARASGKTGVALVSRGPGSCNAAIGLYSAFGESSPVVLVVGSVSDNIAHLQPFEVLDFQTFFKPMTKWTHEVHDYAQIETVTRRAIYDANNGRPRPVVIGVPMQYSQMKQDYQFQTSQKAVQTKAVPDDHALEKAIEIWEKASKPVIVVGGGISRSGAYEPLIRFAEKSNAPVITTWLRNSVFPNDHPLYMGSLGPGAFKVSWDAVAEADVVFAIGTRFSEFSTKRFTLIKPHQQLIHLDIDEGEMNRVFKTEAGLVGDAKLTLQKLNAMLKSSDSTEGRKMSWSGMLEHFNEARNDIPPSPNPEQISNRDVVTILNDKLSKDTTIVLDAATFDPWLSRYYRFTEPNIFLGCAAGCMGFGFPAAMGAKLANPDHPVILTAGDGAFAMVMQDLATAVQEKIGVVVLVTNNSSYGNIRERQRNDFGGRLKGSVLHNPDFAEVAVSFGAWGRKVETKEQFESALTEALAAAETGQPALINIMLHPNDGMPQGSKPPEAR